MIQATVPQTNGTLTQVYEVRLAAAPLREIWFSTVNGFHSGVWQPPTNSLSGGDLLSFGGRVIRGNHALTGRLGIMPAVPDLGLDAVGLLPGGEVAFSIEQDIFSETLGLLRNGDVLSERGRIVQQGQQLLSAFVLQPTVADPGLDALSLPGAAGAETNEVWFSIERDAFSERLSRVLHRGDLLSSRGQIVRSNQQLLARFQPANPGVDYGLDAVYVWPGGEIWFSTEDGFTGGNSESYPGGDLLSDQGYVVFRNLELVGAFAPVEDVNNFGLDALWIVTDAIAPAPPPMITSIMRDPDDGTITLRWRGAGQVFQVEAADRISGPYLPLSPVVPELMFDDSGATRRRPASFYRLRQW
jgi:hypothetical protein